MPRERAMRRMLSMSAGIPKVCCTTIALVRAVMRSRSETGDCVTTVLDHIDAARASDAQDAVHVRGDPEGMLHDDCSGTSGDALLNARRIQIERGVDIGKDRLGACRENRTGHSYAGKGLNNDFIAAANSQGLQNCAECDPAAAEMDS